ncbi:MAG: hypothetical protein LUG16_01480 [Candidatus Gastranaerophilales bacterium]|nr:hypothetical protein [Candidatus Gastranaerophilales bacterium]
MEINKIQDNTSFKNGNMGLLSKGLYTLSNNDMLKAAGIDFFCTDTQRTVLEYKNRGKNAGIEMGFREYTGTFIVGFSAALFALLTSKVLSNKYKPDVKINPSSWATNDALDVFNNIYKSGNKTPEDFIRNTFNSLSGTIGKKRKSFNSIPKEKTEPIIEKMTELIKKPNIDKKELKNSLKNIQNETIKVLGADNEIFIKSGGKELKSNLSHTLRDIADTGRNVFFKEGADINSVIQKLKILNKSRIMLAIPLSMTLAISNQYINRRITKARTGIDNFVGENGYENNVKNKTEQKKEKGLLLKKLLSIGIFLAMLTKTMGIKNPADIINKLEFNGPATGGNTIKTIYATLITGRILAAKDSTELRETNTRDYLGFLNWLVLGDFAAKGTAQLLDRNQENLFNISKQGNGIKHWLSDVSLKSQKEILAGSGNVKKNLRNLNIAQLSGIMYSALMLGFVLPKLNIWITQRKAKNPEHNPVSSAFFDDSSSPKNWGSFKKNYDVLSIDEFIQNSANSSFHGNMKTKEKTNERYQRKTINTMP